ncbi:MAG: hypothetical protein IPL46_14540 [Saprospiraceae bacterium]|nr:hypothetical protein [Saprospiraceae bacterium]
MIWIILLAACKKEVPADLYPTLPAGFRLNGESCVAASWFVVDLNFPEAFLISIEKDGFAGNLDYHLSFEGVPANSGEYFINSDSFPRRLLNYAT